MDIEINLTFLIEPFFYMTKMVLQDNGTSADKYEGLIKKLILQVSS